ncbi:unnamed protein product [Spirodela intermedia]|uniref:Methyltransferase type 11 domain-containing protein n=1 Tax=Spirodela intermedia TaxID=51605 RepID=A0ABN7EAB8_SPIIN|nr:unnamed protein product [Spirodela intermedia]
MADLFETQAEIYAKIRPKYPRGVVRSTRRPHPTSRRGLADHYDRVVATDVSEGQLKQAAPHPKIRYLHTPISMPEDDLVALLGGESSVDLVTVATAVHWFDLQKFYPVVERVLRKPGGVVAVWSYGLIRVCPSFDPIVRRFVDTTLPFCNPNIRLVAEEYRSLPFPFDSVGVGAEGQPVALEMKTEASFEGILQLMRSWSP